MKKPFSRWFSAPYLLPFALVAAPHVWSQSGGTTEGNSTWIERIYTADQQLLVVEIVEGVIERNGQVPYEARTGDVFESSDDQLVLAWVDGKAKWTPEESILIREVEGKREKIGFFLEAEEKVALYEIHHVDPLDVMEMTDSANYRIAVTGESDQQSMHPLTIHRKSKPIDELKHGGGQSVRHRLYLELPEPLEPGVQYRLVVEHVFESAITESFTHQPDKQWTEVIHVNQVGYHPDDPYKQGLLSLWKGTGGAHNYDEWIEQPFNLIDVETDLSVFSGHIRKIRDEDEIDALFVNQKNNSQTSSYALDFSAFKQPGTYILRIPGIGHSYPFTLAGDTWLNAFRTSMMGILHHRSGIELGPPFTDYIRPLNFHPDAGTRLLQIDRTTVSGESDAVREAFERLGTDLEEVPQAWGGYMDAGDWDRRSKHLDATYLHLELLELFPEYFPEVSLALPEDEAENHIPDILDEALWNISFYQRLQTPEGGVRGGVESTAHPRSGEASWQESLLVGVFAPDAVSSYRFAACAAKAARLLEAIDPTIADKLKADAIRAYEWAERHVEQTLESVPENKIASTENGISQSRATAAVELLWLTRNSAYHVAIADELAVLSSDLSMREKHRDSIFTYARLPAELADSQLQPLCFRAVTDLAELALEFQADNPYGIATDNRYLPMMGYLCYFSVPGLISNSLPRAHYLTGDPRFFEATVAACNFANGANPDNLVYTTGLGSHYPTSPLHIDSRVTGQPAPKGITIYGPSDPAEDYSFNRWVHRWRLGSMVPESETWPAAESHVNLFGWPSMSEYTVHQTLGPTSYYWGYISGVHAFDEEEESPEPESSL